MASNNINNNKTNTNNNKKLICSNCGSHTMRIRTRNPDGQVVYECGECQSWIKILDKESRKLALKRELEELEKNN